MSDRGQRAEATPATTSATTTEEREPSVTIRTRTERRPRRGGGAGIRSTAKAVALLAPVLATLALCVGLGLATGAGGGASMAMAAGVTVLPILGLSWLLERAGLDPRRSGSTGVVIACWLWSAALWFAVPSFAPDARHAATRAGARVMLSPLPDPLAATLIAWLGEGAEPIGAASDPAARSADATSPSAEPVHDLPPTPTPARARPAARAKPNADEPVAVVLPYDGDGRMLDIEVTLDGPDYGGDFRMIFDTGASFTTLTPGALERIDVRIPADAPRVKLNTAGGEIEAPLVLLDAVWLGDQPVEWVTVAVCASCTAGDRAGLLGLNVSSQFKVEIDHARKRIHLEPRPGDRRHDVRVWVGLHARIVRHADERLELEVTMTNRAPHAIEAATVEIACGQSGFAVQLTDVPARGEAHAALSVSGGTNAPTCDTFTLDLLTARWALDRF